MTYSFQKRLRHASDRFAKVNVEALTYIRGTRELPIEGSPILVSADEIIDGDPAATRTERQDFAIDILWIHTIYPPQHGDRVRRQKTGEEFLLESMGRDEPPYCHVTSTRDRVIIHTVRVKKARV